MILETYATQVRVNWTHPYSCYEITGFRFQYVNSKGIKQDRPIHQDIRVFDISDLAALSSYNVSISAKYKEGESVPYIFIVKTNNKGKLT